MGKFGSFILMVCCVGISTTASADTKIKLKCGYVVDMMKYSMQGMPSDVTVFSLKKDMKTNIMIFTSAAGMSKGVNNKEVYAPWRLLVRQGDTLQYCLVGAGEKLELLTSVEYANPKNKYGMPGSGYPRCSIESDLLSALDVDLWANKELGQSAIFQFNANLGDKDFRLLISSEKAWILLDSNIDNVKRVCYYSRGNDLVEHNNFKIPSK